MFVCLFSFCFSMTVGVVWEFFEFGADMLFEKDMQKDTVITAIHSGLISGKPNVIMLIRDITSTVVNGENLGNYGNTFGFDFGQAECDTAHQGYNINRCER